MKLVTKTQFIERTLAGEPLLLVEYRSAKPDTLRRKAPKTGQAPTMPVCKHMVLVKDTSFEVMQFLPDDADLAKVGPLAPKGSFVVVELKGMEASEYGNRIEGELCAYDPSE